MAVVADRGDLQGKVCLWRTSNDLPRERLVVGNSARPVGGMTLSASGAP